MIVYFADRQLNVIASASSSLPGGLKIRDDEKTEDVETGVKTFSCRIGTDELLGAAERNAAVVSNFILRSDDDENELYTIVESEQDAEAKELYAYGEDAGLDLINTVVPVYTAASAMTIEQYLDLWLPEGWEIGINELDSKALKLEWTGESTLTERLQSLATEFGGELGYSYEIKGLKAIKRLINIYAHRGQIAATRTLMMGRELSNIITKRSIASLATAYNCKGSTPKGKKVPIDLSGCNYSSDGTTTHEPAVASDDFQIQGKSVYSKSAKERWSSGLDPDGWLERTYTYETTNKKELFSHAVAELKKAINEEVNYELSIIHWPENVKLGDRINVVDDANETYLEGRVLKIVKSVTNNSVTATIGDYLIKTSGISDIIMDLAKEVRNGADGADGVTIAIESSAGTVFHNTPITTILTAVVYSGSETITNQDDLESRFGEGAVIQWITDNEVVHTGFTMSVSTSASSISYYCRLSVEDEE